MKILINNREDFDNWCKCNDSYKHISYEEAVPKYYPCIVSFRIVESNYSIYDNLYYEFIYLQDFSELDEDNEEFSDYEPEYVEINKEDISIGDYSMDVGGEVPNIVVNVEGEACEGDVIHATYQITREDEIYNIVDAERTMLSATSNSVVVSKEKDKLVVVKGLDNYMVVSTDDVLLVCPRDAVEFKNVITDLALNELSDYQ